MSLEGPLAVFRLRREGIVHAIDASLFSGEVMFEMRLSLQILLWYLLVYLSYVRESNLQTPVRIGDCCRIWKLAVPSAPNKLKQLYFTPPCSLYFHALVVSPYKLSC